MAERAKPSDDRDPASWEQSQSAQSSEKFRSGTYIVQVPKDQIYRVPPPQNARIAERHRNIVHNNNKKSCCSRCLCSCILAALVVLLVLGLIAGIFSVLLRPKDPTFYVDRLVYKPHSRSPDQPHSDAEYDITLRAKNSNTKSGILYKEGGVASLSFRQREIARGNYPTFYQDHKNSTAFSIVVHASNRNPLPPVIEESMKNQISKIHVTFSLKIDVLARIRIGIFISGTIKLAVACDVEVDTLAKDTRILAQKCHTKRQLLGE